jgi:segregation and condensation protein B
MNELCSLKNIVETALLTAGRPLSIDQLCNLFDKEMQPSRDQVRSVLEELATDWESRAIELKEIHSGYRLQVRQELASWISRLWEERPSRYSRAFLETLALIAYRQPITRAEVEEIRGVSVSSSIMKTLQEREWVKVLGHREIPGRPALYGTTRKFLDQFNLKSLNELPPLAEIKALGEPRIEPAWVEDNVEKTENASLEGEIAPQ